jgi:hypothetical protein
MGRKYQKAEKDKERFELDGYQYYNSNIQSALALPSILARLAFHLLSFYYCTPLQIQTPSL